MKNSEVIYSASVLANDELLSRSVLNYQIYRRDDGGQFLQVHTKIKLATSSDSREELEYIFVPFGDDLDESLRLAKAIATYRFLNVSVPGTETIEQGVQNASVEEKSNDKEESPSSSGEEKGQQEEQQKVAKTRKPRGPNKPKVVDAAVETESAKPELPKVKYTRQNERHKDLLGKTLTSINKDWRKMGAEKALVLSTAMEGEELYDHGNNQFDPTPAFLKKASELVTTSLQT